MKKFIMFLVFMFPVLLLAQDSIIAVQDTVIGDPDIPVPGGIIDIFADLQGWFASTAAVAGLTIFFTLLVTKLWKTISPIFKQAVALVIALVLMIAGNLANIGFMADFNWLSTVVYGLMVGFVANGWYDLKNVAK
jgi:hypothetical protein